MTENEHHPTLEFITWSFCFHPGAEQKVALRSIWLGQKIAIVCAPEPHKGGFQKGWFWRMFSRNENRNEGYIRMFPRNENRNEGTFACAPERKTGTRVRSPKPPFYETALLSPLEVKADTSGKGGGHHLHYPFVTPPFASEA